jgi:hypothetical protein
MKILHIYNTAGVASILAKTMDKNFGTESKVTTPKTADPFGFTTYGETWNSSITTFKIKSVLTSRKYDIIHCHSTPGIALWIKKVFPNKKVIIHYHGSEIRGRWKQKEKYWSKANKIIVSTPDLLEGSPNATVCIENPVDTELFKNLNQKRTENTALHFCYKADKEAELLAKQNNLKLETIDRNKHPIPYKEMPVLLNKYAYLIDVKASKGKILQENSKTGLEALSCGCKVICWNGNIKDKLPIKHMPIFATEKLFKIYREL